MQSTATAVTMDAYHAVTNQKKRLALDSKFRVQAGFFAMNTCQNFKI
jgi:hypothetical protein